jgi:hypothetical protein
MAFFLNGLHHVAGERFESFWDDKLQEWRYRDARRVDVAEADRCVSCHKPCPFLPVGGNDWEQLDRFAPPEHLRGDESHARPLAAAAWRADLARHPVAGHYKSQPGTEQRVCLATCCLRTVKASQALSTEH